MSVSVRYRLISAVLALAGCGNTYLVPNGGAPTPEGGTTTVLELEDDITIPDDADWQMTGQAGARCVIRGNGHSIHTALHWIGHFSIRSCDIFDLGTVDMPGIHLNMYGAASAVIEDSTFAASGQVHIINYDASTVDFSHNTIFATSLVPAVALVGDSKPVFFAQGGDGTGHKRFAGNLILHSYAAMLGAHWTIGGDSAAEGNRFIGTRAGLLLQGPGLVVRGNYFHTIYPISLPDYPRGQEVTPFTFLDNSPDLLVEHNVIRHGHWILRGGSGEIRYNAIVDADDSDWIREPQTGTNIHHNVFVNYTVPGEETNSVSPNPTVLGGIELINFMNSGIQIWANTFDGGGTGKFFGGPTISVAYGSALESARSNLFMRFVYREGSAGIAPGALEEPGTLPRLGYADYNLFFNPDGNVVDNYALPVTGKIERQDPGFGANDVNRLGAKDEQVDPQITGPLAEHFPWTDDQIASGAVTVSDMLAYFRAVYTPRAGSPLIDAGDPQDGSGSDIGAIGAGAPNRGDGFGIFPATSPEPIDTSEGGLAPSARRDSDGPLTVRCSTCPLGRSHDSEGGMWIVLGMMALWGFRPARRTLSHVDHLPGVSGPRR